jgi:thiamine biosynthesis lipoprotein
LLKRHVKSEGATVEHDWGIQVVDPDNRDRTLVTAFGQGVGVATSGTYEISYVVDGREYSHIIDPWTGEPTQRDIVSVTLVGALAAECDALSTAICIMGRDEAVEFTRMHLSEYRYILLVREGDGFDIVTNMEEGSYIVR